MPTRTPEQKLAREIQAATGRKYTDCLREARARLWDTAIENCLNGHESCSYGGMSASTGYWLQAEDCNLNHGERCTWCGGESETGFSGWADDGFSVYRVPACQPCALKWAETDTRWRAPAT